MNLIGYKAKKASVKKIDSKLKNKVLYKYKSLIKKERNSIFRSNAKDIKYARIKVIYR